MLPQEIIRTKRTGNKLSEEEIRAFVRGLTDNSFTEGQVAAFAMAVMLNGMEPAETVELTLAMRDSGRVLEWHELPGPVSDKHSTGGVGDNVSLMLAPIAAACGLFVPMISGRGLGHTGGTLDKMDTVPGYKSQPEEAVFRAAVRGARCAIIGQTGDLAPADKRFYAIRDITGTVESVPLITASILSKKLAAGLKGLVLDVKSGSGAFMPTMREAYVLAQSLVEVANGAGLPTTALITDMDQPLASAAGNAVEVLNAIDFLTGKHRDARLEEVTLALAAEMIAGAGLGSRREAATKARDALESGRAADTFGRMVHLLGGPTDIIEHPRHHLAQAPVELPVLAARDGYVRAIDTRGVGLAVVELGGGRRKAEDTVDGAVGFTALLPLGAEVRAGEPLGLVHARSEDQARAGIASLRAAYRIDGEKPALGKPVQRLVARGS